MLASSVQQKGQNLVFILGWFVWLLVIDTHFSEFGCEINADDLVQGILELLQTGTLEEEGQAESYVCDH